MMSCMNIPDMRSIIQAGQIQVVFGPMFSGKTTELIRRMKRFQIANYSCLLIKYAKDTRYDQDDVSTHDRQVLPATGAMELMPLADVAEPYEVIGIDEGQFFPDVVPFCEKMAGCGKTVIVAALDGTFQRKGFGNVLDLVPIAESVVKLNAVCMICYGEAAFTKRKGSELKVEVIGGAEKYLAVCRRCYYCPDKESPCKENVHTPFNPNLLKDKANAGRRLFVEPLSPHKMVLS